MDEVGGHVARMEEKRNEYRLLVGKQEERRPLARPRRRWVDNSKIVGAFHGNLPHIALVGY
jgi:hypothetical protein